jgi:hypothetical protein
VSYALEFAERAREDLRRLDLWLQEEILDELDRLAVSPTARRRVVGDVVYDFVTHHESGIFYVFLTVRPLAAANVLRIRSIGVHIRQVDNPTQ